MDERLATVGRPGNRAAFGVRACSGMRSAKNRRQVAINEKEVSNVRYFATWFAPASLADRAWSVRIDLAVAGDAGIRWRRQPLRPVRRADRATFHRQDQRRCLRRQRKCRRHFAVVARDAAIGRRSDAGQERPRAGADQPAPPGGRLGGDQGRPAVGPHRGRGADAPAGRRSECRVRRNRSAHENRADPERSQPVQPVGLRYHQRGHQRTPGLGSGHRHRRGRGGDRYRHHQPSRPQCQHPAGLRFRQRCGHGARRQRPRQRSGRPGRLDRGQRVLFRFAGDQFQLARHACGRHHRRGDPQQHRRGRYRVQCQDPAGARARQVWRLHLRHRRRDHLGVRRHRQRRAGQHHPGRSDQHVAGRQRHLLDHLPECDQRCGQPRHHRGGGGRQ